MSSLKTSPWQVAAICLELSWGAPGQSAPLQLSVDANVDLHTIDPNIYGIAGFDIDPAFAKEIQLPNARWGGNYTTRYNWRMDSSNHGKDDFFIGGKGNSSPVPSAEVDRMIDAYAPMGAGPLITIPIIPYIKGASDGAIRSAEICGAPPKTLTIPMPAWPRLDSARPGWRSTPGRVIGTIPTCSRSATAEWIWRSIDRT